MVQGWSRLRQLQSHCSGEGQSSSPSNHHMDVTSVREPGWLYAVSNSTSESLLHFPNYSHIKVLLLKHLLLKASHHLELMRNQFWFIHINIAMGRANRGTGLSLMFGDIPACPCSLFIANQLHGDFPLFANERSPLKKSVMKSIWAAPTSYCDVTAGHCTTSMPFQSQAQPCKFLATPFLLLPPPHFAVPRAGKFLSRGKVPAAQAHRCSSAQMPWPKAVLT